MLRILASALVIISVVTGCASSVTPSPSASPSVGSASPGPLTTAAPTVSAAPTLAPTPKTYGNAAPSSAPPVATGTLPVRGPGKEIGHEVVLAAGPEGSLFALVPKPVKGAVLTRFERSGRSSPGWPIAIKDVNFCGLLLPVEDGGVRLLCDVFDADESNSSVRAFAFDAGGRSLAGWPVAPGLGAGEHGRVVGLDLVLYGTSPGPAPNVSIIAPNGSITRGPGIPRDEARGASGVIAPDGIAYGTQVSSGYPEGLPEISWITGFDLSGVRAGWPVKVDGIASPAAFGPDGRVVFTIGSRVSTSSRVAVFDRDGNVVRRSARLPIQTATSGADCIPWAPRIPLVAPDGTVFVWSELDSRIFALDTSLKVLPGCPYRPANRLVDPGWDDPRVELGCFAPAAPGVGPSGTLYLPLRPRDESVGGTLVAVDLNGRVHQGWPVKLQRPQAEFLRAVVGTDGTVYALAKEPEAGNSASVTILAIAPDSTVLYRTTIIEP